MKHRLMMIILFMVLCGLVVSIGPAGAAANRGKAAPANLLPAELKNLEIKDYYNGSGAKEVGVIQTAMGHVVVAKADLKGAYYAAQGDRLFEGDVIFTLKGSKCRFKLTVEDVVTMAENTRVGIKAFNENRQQKAKNAVFSMQKGKAMFYALRLFKYRDTAMLVETPTSVTGVRGTKWGVEIVELGESPTASLPIMVADTSDAGFRYLAQANNPNSTTIVHSFEGRVEVLSTADRRMSYIYGGQSIESGARGLGDSYVTPANISQRFQADTYVPSTGGSGDTSGAGQPGGGTTGAAGGAGDNGTTTDSTGTTNTVTGSTGTTNTVDTSTITQSEAVTIPSTEMIDPVRDNFANAAGEGIYSAGMLTDKTGASLEEVFVSITRQGKVGNQWFRGSKNQSLDYIRAYSPGSPGKPWLKWVSFNSGANQTGDLGTDFIVDSVTVLGEYSYMKWDYSILTTPFALDGREYYLNNKIYSIGGLVVPSLVGLTGTGTYSGPAYGTYWTENGGTDMTGSISTAVNFGNYALTNFQMNVSGGGASASISDAHGTVGSNAHFQISGGTWDLNGVTPDNQMAYGSLYGSQADSIGGSWGMYKASLNTGAVGIFQGDATFAPVPVDPVVDPAINYPNSGGYTAGMLTNITDARLEELYITVNRQPMTGNRWARGTKDPAQDYSRIYESGGVAYQKWGVCNSGTASTGDLGDAYIYTSTALGSNSYMNWGYGYMNTPMTAAGKQYLIDNKAYYISGPTVTNPAGLTGTAAYSGPAYGTYWSSTGGINMTGSFGCDVNYSGSAQISKFALSVSGSGAEASISDAFGSIGSDGHFQVSGGTWNLNGTTPDQTKAFGSIYGSEANAIGGAWGMFNIAANTGAVGIYQGDKVIIPVADPYPDPMTNASGTNTGYYSGMMTCLTGSQLHEVFVSENRQDFSSNTWARGTKSPSTDYIRHVGGYSSSPDAGRFKWTVFDSGDSNSGDLGSVFPSTYTTMGSNSWMSWSYFTFPSGASFSTGGNSYAFDNRFYGINGQNTSSTTGLIGYATYSGPAYGTYWSSTGGINMTGSFDCAVNYSGGSQISNFALSVSGSGAEASISGASGSIGSDGHFQVSGGTWNLNGTTPDQTKAFGSIYGSEADGLGGAWGMYNSTANTGAGGIYASTKTYATPYGFITGMMTMDSSGSLYFEDVLMSQTIQSMASPSHTITGTYNSSNFAWIDGQMADKKMVKVSTPYDGEWTGSAVINKVLLGSLPYLDYGTWNQPVAMTLPSSAAIFIYNNGYYVRGLNTTNSQMAALNSSPVAAVYSGQAWGTAFTYDSTTGIPMDSSVGTGTFNATVNFGPSPSVTNINIAVSNTAQNKNVNISGATGTFTSGASQFTFSNTGTWNMNGSTLPTGSGYVKSGYGSLFGDIGQAVAVIYGIRTNYPYQGATGMGVAIK